MHIADWLSDHFDYYDEDDEADYEEDDDEDEWECAFGVRCLMQSVPHLRSQCYTREMAEAWREEQEVEQSEKGEQSCAKS